MATQPLPFAATLDVLARILPPNLVKPRVGIVCGSGLSTLASSLRDPFEVPYTSLPGFGESTGAAVSARAAGGTDRPSQSPGTKAHSCSDCSDLGTACPWWRCSDGSTHTKGTRSPPSCTPSGYSPGSACRTSSVSRPHASHASLIPPPRPPPVTNAAGGLNPALAVGTIVVVHDHLALPNMTGPLNALFGPLVSPDHPRFVPLSDAYSPALRRLAFLAAHALALGRAALAEGTYAWVSGPTYETPAEGRFLRAAGADVVGMSTVPEVLAAREEGMEVVVLSLVTNAVVVPDTYRSIRDEVEAELAGRPVARPQGDVVSHEEVLAVGRQKAEVMRSLVARMVELLPLA
ncbi:nucleoside phosphorylase domain-containing protein [Amylocystis lapponica]|nr:nucleoside phosphorylase domain-containing protein [Amylocystis lapponica]